MDGTKRERKDGRWGTMGKTQGSEVLNHKLTYYHLKWAVKSPGHLNYCDTKTLWYHCGQCRLKRIQIYDVWSKEQTERLSALSEICRGYEWYDGVKRARCSLKLRTKKRVTVSHR